MANYIGTLQDEKKNNFYPHSAYDIKQIKDAGTADFFSDIYAHQFNRKASANGHLVVRVGNVTRASAFMLVVKGHYYDYNGTTEWQASCYLSPGTKNFTSATCTIDNRMQLKTITWATDVNSQVYLIFNYYQSSNWHYGTIYIDKVYCCWDTINFRKLISSDWNSYLTTDLSPYTLTMDCTRRGDLLDAYPVGAIYISADSTNPSSFLGGQWELFGPGRTLVCVDNSDTVLNASKKTGGSTNPLTQHTHRQNAHGHIFKTPFANSGGGVTKIYGLTWNGTSGSGSVGNISSPSETGEIRIGVYANTATNQNTGSNTNHANWQPFITCYIWIRTA